MSVLIKSINCSGYDKIPSDGSPSRIDIYDTYVYAQYSNRKVEFHFEKYSRIVFDPSSFDRTYSKIGFINIGGVDPIVIEGKGCSDFDNVIHFSCGDFLYKRCADFGESVYDDILRAYINFKEKSLTQNPFKKEDYPFYAKFKAKYGVDFDEMRAKLVFLTGLDRGFSSLLGEEGGYNRLKTVYAVAYSEDFFVAIEDSISSDGLAHPINNEFTDKGIGPLLFDKDISSSYILKLKEYGGDKFESIERQLCPMSDVNYIQYVEKINTIKTNTNSTIGLATKELLFGTAAAMNSAQKGLGEMSFDHSFYRVEFSFNSKMPKLCFDAYVVKRSERLQKLISLKSMANYQASQIANSIKGSSQQSQLSAADEIRKYKSLLDDGIITQEEFDKKKKELLNL